MYNNLINIDNIQILSLNFFSKTTYCPFKLLSYFEIYTSQVLCFMLSVSMTQTQSHMSNMIKLKYLSMKTFINEASRVPEDEQNMSFTLCICLSRKSGTLKDRSTQKWKIQSSSTHPQTDRKSSEVLKSAKYYEHCWEAPEMLSGLWNSVVVDNDWITFSEWAFPQPFT